MAANLSTKQIELIDAYWRACNYLCVGMLYLRDNPLLKEPLRPEHSKRRRLRRLRCSATRCANI
jgi:xylulose-5-phosphate/fructose-6-phosphate phosphoketolase